ncbi:MAG: hypothetical protein NUV91_02895 [Candidatus Omnitrophica bacterium]|nr:hypothetical protein [Candidatus Omnitrophota bacterium]
MAKKQFLNEPPTKKTYTLLLIEIVAIYFLCLAGAAYLVVHFQTPLYDSSGHPTLLIYIFEAYYYVIPLILALLFGFLFRPFWENSRNLLFIIVSFHLFYSATVIMYRSPHVDARYEELHRSRLAMLQVREVKHLLFDEDKDGFIERVAFRALVDVSEFPRGKYTIYMTLAQRGQPLPDGEIGFYEFEIAPDTQKLFYVKFATDPQKFADYFERGDLEVNLGIEKTLTITEKAAQVLKFSRWTWFPRLTRWDGQDLDLNEGYVELDLAEKAHTFYILPIKLRRPEIYFKKYVDDFPVDQNGNGKWDQLVIVFEVDSKYEGRIFIQAKVAGAPYPLYDEANVVVGINRIEYKIDSASLKEFGFEGPYELVEFQLFNEDPECKEKDCPVQIKVPFAVYFDNYKTYSYMLDQFER